jgi:hypothetical protein
VNLINLDGLALIGQGSEWFWSMLQFVIVTVTLYAIYRQVRLQASATAIEQASQLQEEWHSSERMMRSRLATLIALRDGKDVATTARGAASDVGNFWERVGYLVKAGHIDERLVYEYFGNSVQLWWAWLTPTVNHWRSAEAEPGIQEHFEWLAKRVAEMDLAKGMASTYDPASIAARLSGQVNANVEAIHTQEQIRSVIVQSAHTILPTSG